MAIYFRRIFSIRNANKFLPENCRYFAMNTDSKTDHLQRTASSYRDYGSSKAVVQNMNDLSPSVKKLRLAVENRHFKFNAGQWIDFIIPGVDTVGGFSMCSSPQKLQNEGLLDLAVKYSDHPPAQWVHNKCKPGSEVEIRSGGDFYYDSAASKNKTDILLIGGGVGINPLMSIMKYIADAEESKLSVHLLYSSGTEDELLFKDEILELCNRKPNFKCEFHVTQESQRNNDGKNYKVKFCRIQRSHLEDALNSSFPDRSRVLCFICGPGSMLETMESELLNINLKKDQILYEKWW